MAVERNRAFAPHCDASVLHAPGECQFCDKYPDWQEYRQLARIAFTGQPTSDHTAPDPATYFRPQEKIELWGGNRSYPADVDD